LLNEQSGIDVCIVVYISSMSIKKQ
jgi:hypothetical protein